MRFALRCALLMAITVAAFTASTFADFPSVTPGVAEAQVPLPSLQTAAVSPTTTPVPSAAIAPTPTSTPTAAPSPTDTATSISTATSTDTATVVTPTATSTAIATATPPVPPPDLPPLTDQPDDASTLAEGTIDSTGGRVATRDGRVTVDFPPDATTETLAVKITRRAPAEMRAPSPDFPFVGVWSFDATSLSTSSAVHKFSKSLTVTVRLGARDMLGFDARNLRFWTSSAAAPEWAPVLSTVSAETATITASMDHFSDGGATASRPIDLAPLLDGRNVAPQSGAATITEPILVPPGRGGLTPDVQLTYDSSRVAEMRKYSDSAGMGRSGMGPQHWKRERLE